MSKSREAAAVPETTQEVRFPLGGIDRTPGFGRPSTQQTQVGMARTTQIGVNVRSFEPVTGRGRGGQRPGLADYIEGPVNGDNVHVQELQAVPATWWVPGNDEDETGGLGIIPGSDALLPVFSVVNDAGLSTSSQSRVIWDNPGSPNDVKSYSSAAVLIPDTGVVAGLVVDQSAVLYQDGQELGRFAITGMASDRNGVVTAVPTGEDLYFFGTKADGTLTGRSVKYDQTQNWTQANIGSTSDLGSDTVDPAFICNDGTTAFINLMGTGIVQVTLATGVAVSPFVRCTNAALTTAAGNRYRNAGQCATNGTVVAVLVATESSPSVYGVVYVDVATGVATAVELDLRTVDPTYPWPDFSGETYLQSDGTDFYLMRYHFERNATDGYKYSRVLKLDGTSGAITQTSRDLAVSDRWIGYASLNDDVYVSSSYGMQAAALNVFGGGIVPPFKGFFDAGSFTSAGLYASDGDATNAMNYNRAVALIGVAGGTVKVAYNGLWTDVTSGTGLNTDVWAIRSTVLFGKVYFADSTSWKRYDAYTNTLEAWPTTAGSQPKDARQNQPRLICTWRGRIVVSGLLFDANNVFMSKVGDATDWQYAPLNPSQTDAIALNASRLGQVSDVVTCLIPYSDDVLLIGGDHSIWMLRGDPLFGGNLDNVTNSVGMAWGNPWCRDPGGTVYFMSSQAAVYTIRPGEKPVQISLKIQDTLDQINLNRCIVRLGWDEKRNEVRVFVTPTGGAQPARHFCYEVRSNAWWEDTIATDSMNPLCLLQWYGNSESDRGLLIGSYDGTVRICSNDAPNDDGTDIESDVVLGPFLAATFEELILKELQPIMATYTSSVRFDVYAGETAEDAIARGSVASGIWESGRGYTDPVRVAGHAVYVRIRANRPHAVEALRVKTMTLGASRARDARI